MTTPERLRRRQIFESWMIAILAALLVLSTLVARANEADDDARDRSTIKRNSQIGACLTTYAAELTDALQDRDAVNKTARAAQEETWAAIHRWLSTQPTGADRGPMLKAISRYLMILGRLERTEAINPYPDIADCLTEEVVAAAYRLTSAYRYPKCLGKMPTIYGTARDDVIHGTDKRDVIRAHGGDDLIVTGGGRDIICAGKGEDTINGGRGYDRARGQLGSDFCIRVEFKRSC